MRDSRRARRARRRSIPAGVTTDTPRVLVFMRSALVGSLIALIGAVVPLAPRTSFWWMVGLAYAFLILICLELWLEPSVKKFRWLSCALLLPAAAWFTIAIPFASAPLDLVAYSPPGDYPPGTPVGGIPWDSHFADLRLGITNPTAADYQGVDLLLKPRGWVYQASILDHVPDCSIAREASENVISMATASKSGKLTVEATRVGAGIDTYDTGGNVYTTVATDSGYRLRCDVLPSHYTIRVIFAVVSAPVQLMPRPKPGQMGMAIAELSGVKRPSDLLGPQPSPKEVLVKGEYKSGAKPLSVDRAVTVAVAAGK
jgi:hypothetical protein